MLHKWSNDALAALPLGKALSFHRVNLSKSKGRVLSAALVWLGKDLSHRTRLPASKPSHSYSWAACLAFLSRAFRILAFAAALEALVALSLRCLALSALARARPPRLPISDITLEI